MTSKELRIGNLIYGVSDRIETVIGIKDSGIIETFAGNLRRSSSAFEIDDLSPIPLSEEWLNRLGFFQLPHFTVMNSWIINLGRNRQLSIGSVDSPNCMAFLQEIGRDANGNEKVDDIICLYNWDYDGQLYVHEVQNFYKDLTRLELEVKQ